MKSIRRRFFMISLFGATAALALAAWFFVTLFNANLSAEIDRELTTNINRLAGTLKFSPDGALQHPDGLADDRFSMPYSGFYWQIKDPARNATLRSPSLFDYALPLPDDEQEAGTTHRYRLKGPKGGEIICQERTITVSAPGGTRELYLAAGIDAATLDRATSDFTMAILPYMAALALIMALLGAFQITWGLRPLSALAERVKDVQERRATRLDGEYPAEINPLVVAMNLLLESQEKAMNKARARASDLAHGLKTPLTVISNNALTLREKGEETIADELDDLAGIMLSHVDRELARSRIAQSPMQRRSDARLDETLNQIVRTLQRVPDGAAVQWSLKISDGIVLPIDPNDLRELLGNIFENAVKWARTTIEATTIRSGNTCILIVEDDGQGVPEDMIPMLTSRGVRLDMEKPGTGLGLSIVKEIAEVYDIALTFENRVGGGLRVTLGFPTVTRPA